MNFKLAFRSLIFTALTIIALAGCKKDAGVGGTSTIVGKVYKHDYDASFQTLSATYPDAEQSVYLIYGDGHASYDDDYKTSYDGSFQFKYLEKGHYKLFIYVKDTTGAFQGNYNNNAPKIVKFADVEISENGSTVTSPDLFTLDNNY